MRDSGSQRHTVPRREHMPASRKTRPHEGHHAPCDGQSEQAKKIGTVKTCNRRAGLVATLSDTSESEGRTPMMNGDPFQDEARLRIMREPGGVAIHETTCGLAWPCVKGKGGHEFLRGMPATRGATGTGTDVKALPRDVQQPDMATGEHGCMFRQSQKKSGEAFSVSRVGEGKAKSAEARISQVGKAGQKGKADSARHEKAKQARPAEKARQKKNM